MKASKKSLVFIHLLIILTSVLSHILSESGCPPAEDLAPCVCYNTPFTVLQCKNVSDAEVVRNVFQKSEGHTYREVYFEDSSLQYLPHDVFEKALVKNLFLGNVTLSQLFDSPPDSLHNLDRLHLENIQILSGMSWELLQPLTQLKILTIYFSSVKILDSKFSEYVNKNLEQIIFYSTETEKLNSGSLVQFTNLNKVAVDACKLTQLSRDIFPRPFNVREFHFNHNRISSIPADLFVDMPNLQAIAMASNLISAIPESAFGGNIGRIPNVWYHGNPLKCDCQMEWIVKNKPNVLSGACNAPKNLYGKELRDLSSNDFSC